MALLLARAISEGDCNEAVAAVELLRREDGSAELTGSINPRATLAQLALNKRLDDTRAYYVGANAWFGVVDSQCEGSRCGGSPPRSR